MWNTYSLTRFYDADGTLLAEHRNTENHEFMGYVAAGPGDRIKTIEFDGVPEQPGNKQNKIFQVGQVDDLYVGYGSARSGVGGEEESSTIDEVAGDERPVDQAGPAQVLADSSNVDKRVAGGLLVLSLLARIMSILPLVDAASVVAAVIVEAMAGNYGSLKNAND